MIRGWLLGPFVGEHTRCSPRDTPLQSTLWKRYCHSTLRWQNIGAYCLGNHWCYALLCHSIVLHGHTLCRTRHAPVCSVTYVVPHQARSRSPGDIRCAAPGTLQITRWHTLRRNFAHCSPDWENTPSGWVLCLIACHTRCQYRHICIVFVLV